jgi:hypothetical protein
VVLAEDPAVRAVFRGEDHPDSVLSMIVRRPIGRVEIGPVQRAMMNLDVPLLAVHLPKARTGPLLRVPPAPMIAKAVLRVARAVVP